MPECKKVISDVVVNECSEKIEKARLIAMQLRGEKAQKQIVENKYDFADSQLTLFDIAS